MMIFRNIILQIHYFAIIYKKSPQLSVGIVIENSYLTICMI
jgi:hypothetical protein